VIKRIFWLLLILVLNSCVTLPVPTKLESDLLPKPGAKVVIGTITDSSHQTFDVDTIALLHKAMLEAFSEENILATQDTATSY
jgi:hypothetical protein